MNAEIRAMKTAAEVKLADAFAAAHGRLPGGATIAEQRVAAFRRFEDQGLPHRRVEEWKYTDLRALMREARPLARVPDEETKLHARKAGEMLAGLEARRVVFVDGSFVPELSDLASLEPGLRIGSMAAALARADNSVVTHLGRAMPLTDAALALNTAFMGDGAVVDIEPRVALARPLHLVFINAGSQPSAVFLRSLVRVGKGARAMLVESHEGTSEHQVNTALELEVAAEAHVDHVKISGPGAGALHVSTLLATVGPHVRFNEFLFTLGSRVLRNQLFVHFAGEGTIAAIRGASLLKARQHADTTLVAEHAACGCTSRELFKSVLDGESHGVFQGKIIVRPHAQKTDAKMATHALLLSDTAEADNKPELEIFADDVQCGHGATAGSLDEDLLFYLRARGIPEKEAEALLIQAFVGEAVEGIEHAGLRDCLMEHVVAWLAARKQDAQ
jgi:Fe-S cluster assembly protein SufD